MTNIAPEQDKKSLNFIEQIVENDLKVLYVSAEKFTQQFISALIEIGRASCRERV